MITKMELSVDLSKPALCSTTAKKVTPTSIGNGLAVNIPLLMSSIPCAEPKESLCTTKGKSIFLNDSGCKITTSSKIMEQNYIMVKKEDNASLTRILVLDPTDNNYVIPEGTKLQATFTHGKLSHITFNTNTFV